MSETNENISVPKIRFPEFVNDGEWNINRLADIGDILQGFGFPETYQGKKSGDYPFIKVSDISNTILKGNFFIKEALNYVDNKDVKDLRAKTIPIGSTIFAKIGEAIRLNRRAITSCECLIDNNVAGVKAIQGKATDNFIYYVLLKVDLIEYSGGAVPSINKTTLENIPVLTPKSNIEQQKVADCLSSLDEVITAESLKLEVLKEHKKGLLQNLFPQEGETVPKVRFKEFEDSDKWKEKTIEKIAKVTTGNKDTQNKVDNGVYPFFVRSQNVERINSYSYDGEAILTSGDGVGVGKNFHYINGKFNFHQRVYCICDFVKEVSGKFIFMYFSQHFFERVMRMSAKNSVDSVRMAMITEMPILIPSIQEQQKIASCLSFLDDLINAQSQKVETLKLHKKGLLQSLFPDVNKVSV